MVDLTHARLSIVRQCRLVSVARSSFYYEGTGESPVNLRLLRGIDFYGSRQMTRSRHGLAQTGAPPDATAGGAGSSNGPGRLRLSGTVTRSADHAAEPLLPISHCSEAFCTSSR